MMRSLTPNLSVFRLHQQVMMAVAWLFYALPVALLAFYLVLTGDSRKTSYVNGEVPFITTVLRLLYAVILLASVVLIPLWILRYCKEQRDWFAFALWIVLSLFIVGWASALIIMPGMIVITGGQVEPACCVDRF